MDSSVPSQKQEGNNRGDPKATHAPCNSFPAGHPRGYATDDSSQEKPNTGSEEGTERPSHQSSQRESSSHQDGQAVSEESTNEGSRWKQSDSTVSEGDEESEDTSATRWRQTMNAIHF